MIKKIRLHTCHAFIFSWCFIFISWTFWYMLCKWKFLLVTFTKVLTLTQSFLWLASSQVIFIINMNFKIVVLDKIFTSCSCRVSVSIFNNSIEEISSLISTLVLLNFSSFLSNYIWISASGSILYSSRIKPFFPS